MKICRFAILFFFFNFKGTVIKTNKNLYEQLYFEKMMLYATYIFFL